MPGKGRNKVKETPSGGESGQPGSSSRASGREGRSGEGKRDPGPGGDDLPDQQGDQEDMEYDMEKIPSFEEYMQNRVFTFVHPAEVRTGWQQLYKLRPRGGR